MLKIGLTGGICAGKSTVLQELAALGAAVIDADKLGHKTYTVGSEPYHNLVAQFGDEIVAKDSKEIDRKVLGGNYTGHYGDTPVAIKNVVAHPVLDGVGEISSSKLYKAGPLAESATLLQTGSTGGKTESVTWVNSYKGGRCFYTSCGLPNDFADEDFRRMLVNAIYWTAKREAKTK